LLAEAKINIFGIKAHYKHQFMLTKSNIFV